MDTGPNTSHELAVAATAGRGLTTAAAVKLAKANGMHVPYQTLRAMRAGSGHPRPRPDTVRGIAWLARVDEAVAFRAMGLPVPGEPQARIESLSDLVAAAAAYRGSTVRELCRIAERHGFSVAYSTLHSMHAGTYRPSPRRETLEMLSWLAGVDDEVAFRAAGQEPG
ncbi:hypothetical protein LG293_15800 (plasmid) [Citricoccus nitrophenolicus]